jgi:GNAT superfamily N-acetyltransferase
MAEHVVELRPYETHPVRLAVLRADTPTKEVAFAEDTWPGVSHLGMRLDGELVATSSWIPRPCPSRPGRSAIQLRGMATMQHLQGTGVGGRLLQAGLVRARAAGAELVWANARDSALAFYTRHGFQVVGDGFVDAVTQLPHHVIVLELS